MIFGYFWIKRFLVLKNVEMLGENARTEYPAESVQLIRNMGVSV